MTEPTPRQYGGIKSGLTKDKDAFWRMFNGYKNGGLERAVNNTQAESLKRYIDRYSVGAQTLHNKLKFHADIYNQKKAENHNHTDLTVMRVPYVIFGWASEESRQNESLS